MSAPPFEAVPVPPAAAPAAPAFSWPRAVLGLLRPATPPPGWLRAAALVYLLDAAVIAGCIAGSFYFYGNAHRMFGERQPGTFASVAALLSSGVVCLKVRRRVVGSPIYYFWIAFGVLLCVTAGDDLFQGHERTDWFIHWLLRRNPDDVITDHLDDLFVVLYGLPALYLGFLNARRLTEARLTLQLLVLAFAIFAVHMVIDIFFNLPVLEESMKLTAGCTIFLAFYAVLKTPVLPASWTTVRPPGEWYYQATPATAGATTLRASQPWVRATAATTYVAVTFAAIGALFAVAAGRHEPEARRLFDTIAGLAVVAGGALFLLGHQLFGYSAGLSVAPATPGLAGAHLRVWRATTAAAVGLLATGVLIAVYASRQYPYVESPTQKHHVKADDE